MRAVGLGGLTRPWLSDPATALWAIIAVDIWKWTGFHMVLYLAGLQTIPRDLYEAATIDGAGRWRQLFDVTLPMLAPVTFVNVLLALNGAFVRNFDLVYVMTGGGPNHQTEVVLTHMVAEAFRQGNLGYSAAMGYVLFAIVAVISAVYIRIGAGRNARFLADLRGEADDQCDECGRTQQSAGGAATRQEQGDDLAGGHLRGAERSSRCKRSTRSSG